MRCFFGVYNVHALSALGEHLHAGRHIGHANGVLAVVNALVNRGGTVGDHHVVHQLVDEVPGLFAVIAAEIGQHALQLVPCAGAGGGIAVCHLAL